MCQKESWGAITADLNKNSKITSFQITFDHMIQGMFCDDSGSKWRFIDRI